MKKITVSLILITFMFGIFYPAIYAAENIITNTVEEDAKNKIQSEENKTEENNNSQNQLNEENIVVEENTVENTVIQNVTENSIKTENANQEVDVSLNADINTTETTAVTGKMWIEKPENEQSCVLPEDNIIDIQGWAVSTDSQATLKLYLDNQLIKEIDTRTSRPDVDNNVSGQYGGVATTPQAGFKTTLDISKTNAGIHTIKIDQLSSAEEIITTESRTINVKQTKYTGKMYTETPTSNQSFTLPNSNKITVKGWAVSGDNEAVLKLYVNNKYIQTITKRTKRADVDKAVSGSYGGTTATPYAGFETTLEISTFTAGTHTIKIEQVSRYGAVICKDERKINIKQTKYTGKMYTETPTNNQSFTLPNSKKITVKGWAVSRDNEAILKLYVNNKYIQTITKRTKRADVDKVVSSGYGGTTATPNAGFETMLDVTTYAEGTYTIKIEQVSRYGAVICKDERKINIKQTRYKGKMYIETPTNNQAFTLPNSNKITVKGWAVSEDRNAELKMYIDNKYVQTITKRTKRADVDKAVSRSYGGTTATPYAGFETTLDISTFTTGSHTVKIEEISRFGRLICSTSTKINVNQVQYKGKMNIESFPVLTYSLPKNNIMNIFGWAVSDDVGAYMIVTIDGKQYSCSTTRTKRTDVDKAVSGSYGGTACTAKAGFSINVNIANLYDGMHTVVVSEVSRYHKIMASAQIKLKVVTPNYTGLMNIESPIRNKRYPSGWLNVQGWAITECSGDFIKVYLDGKYQTIAEGTKRPDVLGVYGSKYPNHNQYAGFISSINTTGLAEGTHTIKLEHCSRYGKVIETTEVPFTISNTTTWGIDVSHHNGTIDWNAVRNQGVNFAILKIGEYRDSSRRIIVDEHFNQYYSECKRLGIAVGGYFYSYAFDSGEASREANACLSAISGKSFEMPIFFDIEDDIVTDAVNSGRTNRDNLTNAAITFCDILNSRGYKSGVYSSRNFFYSYLNMGTLERYNIWLAHYVPATDYSGRYDMWQYTSSGSVPGINGPVDLNWCFRRYY